jgi:hypothetical protein
MYLQNLHIDLIRAREKSDFGAFILAIVTVVIVPPSVVIGMCALYMLSRMPIEFWNDL